MKTKIFIDGEVGTTGLQIKSRLEGRDDVELLSIPEQNRKDADARAEMLNGADIAILCLPDAASIEAVGMLTNPNTKVIDASTAHRVNPDWVYGFPELNAGQAEKIAGARFISNVGCYAVASISIINPLVSAGIIPPSEGLSINAISGYSGGGRQMIESFEDKSSAKHNDAPFFVYGLTLEHKHVPEIQAHGGLSQRPLFVPSVGRFAQGMIVQLPLQLGKLPGNPKPEDIHACLSDHYASARFVNVEAMDKTMAMGEIRPDSLNGTNELRLHVLANKNHGHAVVVAVLDNLGKGASGSAIQNMNLMMGVDEGAGL
ncbi:MAG: N-acetyl-gamma-glutamyl-phosphate reductase [Rhodospirillaceae bacterium]|nr:N-acetyl-gamma-glutamyl-phosphate reductase [Rhodospirillaceae bacterium]